MRTRNGDSSKAAAAKKTPPARKSASKSPANAKSPQTPRTSTIRTRQGKKNEVSPLQNSSLDEKPEQSSEKTKAAVSASQVTPDTKVATPAKSTPKRTPGRPRKTVSTQKQGEQVVAIADETPKGDDFAVVEKAEEPQNVERVEANENECEKVGKQDGCVVQSAGHERQPMEVDESVVANASELLEKERDIVKVEVSATQDAPSLNQEEPLEVELTKSSVNEYFTSPKEGEQEKKEHVEKASEKSIEEETNCIGCIEQSNTDYISMEVKEHGEQTKEEDGEKALEKSMEEDGGKGLEKSMEEEANNITGKEESNTDSVEMEVKHQYRQDDVKPEKDNLNDNQGTRGSGEKLDLGEQREEFVEDDPEEPHEETETLDEEGRELTAIAKERKIKKEHEIFVGGLDRDATEEDLKKVFEKIGEVVDVRLHKNSSTNKNKGYAFVKFSCQEHAKKALSEMKNPVIRGKRCGTAPSEDNDTLFLGNICNTWTKEAIKQKLKDYGVEGVESITLVPDVQHEGLSRGFAFLEFSCHADAMLAYKRLQKPDVIFGHAERTAKVAFAEPVREPDPEVMAQVKSVFIDGLPPHWDEDCIREHFKGYGEIVRIVLARNMSSAKRKDFGFVDFSSHEGAVTCVDGVNSSEFVDGASKTKVRARLSNPLPKTQAVKGSMCGGFRIGHARTGAYTRSGRGFTRGGQTSNLGNFNKDRNFNHGGRGQIGRTGFQNDLDHNNMHPDFHRRQFGERMGPLRGGHYAGGQGAAIAGPSRPYLDRAWYGTPKRGPAEAIPPRMPFSPEGQFDRPLMGRHFDDPYLYDDNRHGVKRPFYMTDPDPNYLGPVRFRPRLDYTDPAVFHGSRHHDSIGTGSGQYSRDYYGSDYGGGPYSSFYGGDNPYGRGFHY
ncbi:nucleolin-like isoform X1 [Senna tora]|uniref:Nucleolin-like isoform X1 n=1 Tax=Senna tora TaxID=362788 RepID=A0A834TYB5_9FABA|nr:nucleolin-like isoform X1 [Senna tora]